MMTILLERDWLGLWKKGFEVFQAEGVQKGIDSVKSKKPGFAVVDLRLGDGNGLEVLRKFNLQILQAE